MCVCVCVCMYVCMYVRMYTDIRTYVYIHSKSDRKEIDKEMRFVWFTDVHLHLVV